MKENQGAAIFSISKTFGRFVGDMSRAMDGYRRENEALREILLERSLKQRQIRTEVRKRVKGTRDYEGAFEILEKVCQRMQALLLATDPLANAVENLAKTKKRDVN